MSRAYGTRGSLSRERRLINLRCRLRRRQHPPFESLAQRKDITAESLQKFMTITHRGLNNPNGMPNPMLMDYQVKQIVAYFLSLRKR
jgi:hypothetical protein